MGWLVWSYNHEGQVQGMLEFVEMITIIFHTPKSIFLVQLNHKFWPLSKPKPPPTLHLYPPHLYPSHLLEVITPAMTVPFFLLYQTLNKNYLKSLVSLTLKTKINISLTLHHLLGFLGGASGEEPACQHKRHERRGLDAWVGKIPWRRAWQPTSVFLPGESLGQRILVGYSPWSHRELDKTEWLSTEDMNVSLCCRPESNTIL